MQKTILISTLLLLSLATQAPAVKTRKMQQSSFASFERGKTVDRISILHGGKLTPARQQELWMDTGDPHVWDLALDRRGNFYIATGNDGRIYRRNAKGDSTLFFDAPELQVFALALDRRDRLIAATSPRGKVYRFSAAGEADVIFATKEPYIWDLAVDSDNAVYVATGDPGRIYRIGTDGKTRLFFDSGHAHIRCLVFDRSGRLYAGSGQKGVVYRIDSDGKAFALHDPLATEVHALAIAPDGTVYAATMTEPTSGLGDQLAQQLSRQAATTSDASDEVSLAAQSILIEAQGQPAQAQASLLRIDPSGYAREIWDFPRDAVQSLLMTDEGLLVGTGSEGKIYRLDAQDRSDLLCRFHESPVTALLNAGDSWIVATANMAKVFRLAAQPYAEAVFESETIDAGSQARWGVFEYEGELGDGDIRFFTRSGNTEQPGSDWSDWQPLRRVEHLQIISPKARFVQWKAVFQTSGLVAPMLNKVVLAYQQLNLAPRITSLIIHEPGVYYESDNTKSRPSDNSLVDFSGLIYPESLPSSSQKKGARSADWIFDDPNLDPLVFDLDCQLLPNGPCISFLRDAAVNVYSWDSFQLADGRYRLKLIAKDSPRNSADETLAAEKESDPFIVDNSAPELTAFEIKAGNGVVTVLFEFIDAWSALESLHYSLDADGWSALDSQDGLIDSPSESFRLLIPLAANETAILALRAVDSAGNIKVEHKRIRNP
ncbi:hypothetical protein JW992_10555 [candidate division KSB1 bacterium]|nr:hypothetical protein [candidate division KSB1 bacterium]